LTNPIKRFFQILKDIVLLPIRFLQMRRSLQEVESLRQLPRDPKERRKLFAKMGMLDEMGPMFDPVLYQQRRRHPLNEVDLSYLEEEEEEGEENDEEDLES
jgi:hypothetical protein